ncbi:hypothetical protein [Desulfonatronum thiodismutans]|uniref:hypothetical protein n=1 Tax=Desulfonatronum thiodismutans TaxID=159290 RepID=UPI001F1CDAAD|nr:hypothetical protein [Desulfonatronum thiodismutans]
MREFVNKLAEEHANKTTAVSILTNESGQEIERRVSNFLGFLDSTGCISFNKNDKAYSQTLLGAADVAEHYSREITYLVPRPEINSEALKEILVEDEPEDDNEPDQEN